MLNKLYTLYRWSLLKFAIFVTCCLMGCNNFLDKKSNSSLLTPNTLESLQMLLDSAHDMNFNVPGYGQASADDHFLVDKTFNGLSERDRNRYLWKIFDEIFNNDWAKGYIPVYQANLVLDQLSDIERTPTNALDWDNVRGSALFFRAYYYLALLWTYSHTYDKHTATNEYGIVLRDNSDPNVPSRRASAEESYNKVIQDLKEAVKLLPLRSIHPMRPSKVAAYATLARTYLSMSAYSNAYDYVDTALYYHNELLDYENPDEVNISSAAPFGQFNKEIIFYSEVATIHPTTHPTICFIDTILYHSYKNDDLRKSAYFTTNLDGYPSFKGTYASTNTLFTGIATDELYFMRAECGARIGNHKQAVNDLNMVMKSRWKKESFTYFDSNNPQTLLMRILEERRRGLLMRGLRWMDIKRFNAESPNITLKRIINGEEHILPPDDNMFALPIPADVIEITGIPQNKY